ncbi:Chitinase 2 [Entomophthora muscae]|uniref:Chitinase 2 n=1 Tax=Entomophthora muscae TaxID=34485 RepID=A0ACC2U0X6_9FUNG|nr:Chitinase 2 [Entomophthora muscae]
MRAMRLAWVCLIRFAAGFENVVEMDYSGDLMQQIDPYYNLNSEYWGIRDEDRNAKLRYAVYWGQNSYGASHLNTPELWEKPLREYCQDETVDLIILSFLNIFNAGTEKPPELNLAHHCNTTFEAHPMLLKCPEIGNDIIECQQRGKKVLLSLGGAAGSYGFTKVEDAASFAKTVWNMFLGGRSTVRPFGKAVLDGVDLDIEGGSPLGYPEMVHTFRELYTLYTNKRFYVAAAPQCVFPDAFMGTALDQAWFDFVFVQFYNNYCGVQSFNNPYGFNFHEWDIWARLTSLNPRVKLFVGIPGSTTAANSGYLDPDSLLPILSNVSRTFPTFSGVMAWDASQGDNNRIINNSFSSTISSWLKNPKHISFTSTPTIRHATGQEGTPCQGNGLGCQGTSIAICTQGVWTHRPCPSQETCVTTQGYPVCHYSPNRLQGPLPSSTAMEIMPLKRISRTKTLAQLKIWTTTTDPIPGSWSITINSPLNIVSASNAQIMSQQGSTLIQSLPDSPPYMSLRISLLIESIPANRSSLAQPQLLPRLAEISLN